MFVSIKTRENGPRGNHLDCFDNFKINPFGRKEGRKEMFYLMTHSKHFIYGYMASELL